METATEQQITPSPFTADQDRRAIWANNEWMRRYIEEPESFKAEFRSVVQFLEEESKGEEPSYGASCHAYMIKLMAEAPTG